MRKSYKSQSFFSEIKYSLSDCFKINKIKLLVCGLVLLAAFITGIIIGIKYYDTSCWSLSQYGLVDFSGGVLSSSFFTRFFSMLLLILLLFACSFTPFTFPLAILILAYRTYLLALNLTLLFIIYGIPGMIISVIIALPCQLLIILSLLVYYLLLFNCNCSCKRYGSAGGMSKIKLTLIVTLLLLILNLIETILLAIFHAQVILVL